MARASRLSDLAASVVERARSRTPNAPIVVALSGGADSAVCLWVVLGLGRPVRAVFIDHGFPESGMMEQAAVDVAKGFGVDLDRVPVVVAGNAGPEAAARSARYRALEGSLRTDEVLVTGHTADDDAETVLANLLRGAGATGLGGIPGERGRIARPLLDVWRAETRQLAVEEDLPVREDPANSTAEPLRNRLRRELLPFLESQYSSGLRAQLHRTSGLAASDDAALDAAAAGIEIHRLPDRVRLAYPQLLTVPPAVAARAVRRALRLLSPPYPGSSSDVLTVLGVAAGGPPGELAGGFRVVRNGPHVDLVSGTGRRWSGTLRVPGALDGPGFRIESHITTSAPFPWPLGRASAVVDADVVGPSLSITTDATARALEAGGHRQKVGELLRAAGVPRELRSGWPVAAAHGKLAWVVGTRTADWVRATSATKRWLWLQARMEAW